MYVCYLNFSWEFCFLAKIASYQYKTVRLRHHGNFQYLCRIKTFISSLFYIEVFRSFLCLVVLAKKNADDVDFGIFSPHIENIDLFEQSRGSHISFPRSLYWVFDVLTVYRGLRSEVTSQLWNPGQHIRKSSFEESLKIKKICITSSSMNSPIVMIIDATVIQHIFSLFFIMTFKSKDVLQQDY